MDPWAQVVEKVQITVQILGNAGNYSVIPICSNEQHWKLFDALTNELQHLTARLAAAEAAARFYARYYDGPSEALLGEADRMAFQWIESDANEVKP